MEALRRAGFLSEISLEDYFETVCDCADAARGPDRPSRRRSRAKSIAPTASRMPELAAASEFTRLAALNETGKIARFACADHQAPPAARVCRPRMKRSSPPSESSAGA